MAHRDERLEHTRRQLIKRFGAAAGAFIVVPLAAGQTVAQMAFASDPFQLGIASGDPAADGFVIWTRLAPKPFEPGFGMGNQPIEVDWEVASDEAFTAIAQSGKAVASPLLAHSVHVEVAGLQPARPYWYRFRAGGAQSPVGRAKTTPIPGAPLARVKFAVAGCQSLPNGFFSTYKHLIAEDPDFVFCYGDYIYEGGEGRPIDVTSALAARRHLGGEIFSVDDYRRRYAQYKADADLRAAHAAAAWYPVWDDHEIENNWVSAWDQDGSAPELFNFRRQGAMQAYYEHMPLRRSSMPAGASMQIYRRAVFGDLLDLNLLDTRQFRSNQPCNDKWEQCTTLPEFSDPRAEVMGRQQEDWLFAGFKSSKARWKALAQQVMMMDLDRNPAPDKLTVNTDSWAGYRTPRNRVLKHIQDNKVANVVVLTGDEHQNFAGELHLEGAKPGPKPIAVEFVATSITSGGDGLDQNEESRAMLANNQQLKFINRQRGYITCDVTKERWETAFRVMDKVSVPGGAISTRTKLVVEPGSNRLTQA